MNKKLLMGLVAMLIISIASLGIVLAYRGDSTVNGPNYDADVHEQLEAAIESGDYDTWMQIRQDNNLPTKGRMFQVINKDNFNQYKELHSANLAGDTVKADAIKAELGLGQGMMKKGQVRMHDSRNSHSQGFMDSNNDGVCDNTGKYRT